MTTLLRRVTRGRGRGWLRISGVVGYWPLLLSNKTIPHSRALLPIRGWCAPPSGPTTSLLPGSVTWNCGYRQPCGYTVSDTGNFTGNHVPPTREEPAIQRGGNNQITQHATDQNAQSTKKKHQKNSKTHISSNASATAAVAASFIQIQPSL